MADAFLHNGVFCRGGVVSRLGFTGVGTAFVPTWLAIAGVTVLSVAFTSGPLFYWYYWPSKVTYEKWTRKSNPKFPSPEKVRDEIIQMLKGVLCAAMCPAYSVWAANQGLTKSYCGTDTPWGQGGLGALAYHAMTFAVVLLLSDAWEFYYHYLGHKYKVFWEQHRHHHKFFNPSPFAVIADEFVDQFFRAMPMALFPLAMPINIDLMYAEFGFVYAYGCYLHWGYECDWLDAHHPWINTAFQHYCHHNRAIMGKPYHCGFFLKCWDQLFGSTYDGECFCVKCERAKGKRSRARFERVVVPDYAQLLQPSFWISGKVLTGATSTDKNLALDSREVADSGEE